MYQLGDVLDNPIPTSIIRIVWHTVKVITNDILGVKGLRSITPGKFLQSACNLHNVIILIKRIFQLMSIFCFFCYRHSRHCFAILVLATSDTIMGEMFLIVFISNTHLLLHFIIPCQGA